MAPEAYASSATVFVDSMIPDNNAEGYTSTIDFTFEGEVFSAYNSQVEGSIPVHRFFNGITGTHFYTSSDTEKEIIETSLPNYQYEDVAYYVFPIEGEVI